MRKYTLCFAILTVLVVSQHGIAATIHTQKITYQSTLSAGIKGQYQLNAEINYPTNCRHAPIAVVLHGFSLLRGNINAFRINSRHLADLGFFVITPALRGRDGSDGKRDCGELEVYDIYDAVEFVKQRYPSLVDSSNVHIVGYSGGGGLGLLAACRFPDYFRLVCSFFGMSDYGYDSASGWFYHGATADHQRILTECIGDPHMRAQQVLDRYMARSARFGAPNCRGTEMHLFVNRDEQICPIEQDSLFVIAANRNNSPGQLSANINLHIGYPKFFEDFNRNRRTDDFEEQYWPHFRQSVRDQRAAEGWYMNRLVAGELPPPVFPDSGLLYVPGFAVTKKFSVWLGTGENAAGTCTYLLSANEKKFCVKLVTSDTSIPSKIMVNCKDMKLPITIMYNDSIIVNNWQSSVYECKSLKQNVMLRICSNPTQLRAIK